MVSSNLISVMGEYRVEIATSLGILSTSDYVTGTLNTELAVNLPKLFLPIFMMKHVINLCRGRTCKLNTQLNNYVATRYLMKYCVIF